MKKIVVPYLVYYPPFDGKSEVRGRSPPRIFFCDFRVKKRFFGPQKNMKYLPLLRVDFDFERGFNKRNKALGGFTVTFSSFFCWAKSFLKVKEFHKQIILPMLRTGPVLKLRVEKAQSLGGGGLLYFQGKVKWTILGKSIFGGLIGVWGRWEKNFIY